MIPWLDDSGLVGIEERAWLGMVTAPAPVRSVALGARAGAAAAPSADPGGVLVIPIEGAITLGASMWTDLFGGTALDTLTEQITAARRDRSIRGVVLDVNSPGGGVHGVDEVAASIAALAKVKPVIGFTRSVAASAAYWLMASASKVVAAPSAEVGSIGVFAVHFDLSGAMSKEGIVPTLVKAGKFKAEGHPYAALSDADRDALEARIGAYYGMFVKRVARGRGVPVERVRDGFGEGRVVGAADALAEGMIDVIGDRNLAIAMAGEAAGAGGRVAASADVRRAYLVALEDAAL